MNDCNKLKNGNEVYVLTVLHGSLMLEDGIIVNTWTNTDERITVLVSNYLFVSLTKEDLGSLFFYKDQLDCAKKRLDTLPKLGATFYVGSSIYHAKYYDRLIQANTFYTIGLKTLEGETFSLNNTSSFFSYLHAV